MRSEHPSCALFMQLAKGGDRCGCRGLSYCLRLCIMLASENSVKIEIVGVDGVIMERR